MQLGLQVALLSARVCAAWTCNVRQAETIEQNNQMLSSLGTLDTKVDSVSSKVDSVSSSMQDIAEKQDSLNKQVGSPCLAASLNGHVLSRTCGSVAGRRRVATF